MAEDWIRETSGTSGRIKEVRIKNRSYTERTVCIGLIGCGLIVFGLRHSCMVLLSHALDPSASL